jgi:hypothetical protein
VQCHAIEEQPPLHIGGGGVIEVDTPSDAFERMKAELAKYQKFFENVNPDTFVSLSE